MPKKTKGSDAPLATINGETWRKIRSLKGSTAFSEQERQALVLFACTAYDARLIAIACRPWAVALPPQLAPTLGRYLEDKAIPRAWSEASNSQVEVALRAFARSPSAALRILSAVVKYMSTRGESKRLTIVAGGHGPGYLADMKGIDPRDAKKDIDRERARQTEYERETGQSS